MTVDRLSSSDIIGDQEQQLCAKPHGGFPAAGGVVAATLVVSCGILWHHLTSPVTSDVTGTVMDSLDSD